MSDVPWSCTTDHQMWPGCGTCSECRRALVAGWIALANDRRMTDADRVRKAANVYWIWADSCCEGCDYCDRERAQAELLESIADDMDTWNGFMPENVTNGEIHKKAIELTNKVIGKPNDQLS